MINREEIEAGDKCYTRDGGCLVAREFSGNILLGTTPIEYWEEEGFFDATKTHPLDIIRIEKAPKPLFYEIISRIAISDKYTAALKLVFINGVWDKDKSEQVK